MGDAGDARRGDVDRQASSGPGDGARRRGDGVWPRRRLGSLQAPTVADGGVRGWAGGAALGALARVSRLLRTPPRRTCVTRAGANFQEFPFQRLSNKSLEDS